VELLDLAPAGFELFALGLDLGLQGGHQGGELSCTGTVIVTWMGGALVVDPVHVNFHQPAVSLGSLFLVALYISPPHFPLNRGLGDPQ